MGLKNRGRKIIYSNIEEIDVANIVDILKEALSVHFENVKDMTYLLNYVKGEQDILKRSAPSTSSINNKVVLNYAYSSIRDILGYTFGKPIEVILRSGNYKKDLKEIVDILEYENSDTVDNEVATYSAICGVGYFCTLPSPDITEDSTPDIPITLTALDPRNTFVVNSRQVGNRVLLSCTYWKDDEYTYYTVYTRDSIYSIKSKGAYAINENGITIEEKKNELGMNPIQIVKNNLFLMGDFEIAIEVLDAVNMIASDSVNDVENVIKSLLVLINAELDDDSIDGAKKNRILELMGAPGSNVDAKFLYQQLDSTGINDLREYLEEAFKVIIGIPDRKTRGGGGGDTGDAVKLRDGWADIEIVARNKEKYFKIAKREQLSVVIKVLKSLNLIKDGIKLMNLDIKFSRNKNDNLQTKAQSFATLHGTKTIDPVDALEMCELTTDTTEVIARGTKYWKEQNKVEENKVSNEEIIKEEVVNEDE